MYNSIRNMHLSMSLREALTENFWAEREAHQQQVQRERNEIDDLQDKIWYYGFNQNAEKYDAWMEAGPNTRTSYLEYCRKEWACIVDEIVLAHKLAGFVVTPVYKQS